MERELKIVYLQMLNSFVFVIGILSFVFGIIYVVHYTYDNDLSFEISMDNNTRIAIESLNETINNLEIPNTMVYGVEDCQFITDKQEYWCIDELKRDE